MLSGIVSRYKNYRRYRNTVNELQSLSNRELSDLGIPRGEISRIARECID